jgi:hypothetical protein
MSLLDVDLMCSDEVMNMMQGCKVNGTSETSNTFARLVVCGWSEPHSRLVHLFKRIFQQEHFDKVHAPPAHPRRQAKITDPTNTYLKYPTNRNLKYTSLNPNYITLVGNGYSLSDSEAPHAISFPA